MYKLESFKRLSQQNPGMKISKINALITENWNSLDGSMKEIYEIIHREKIERYKNYWVEAIVKKDVSYLPKEWKNTSFNDEFEENIISTIRKFKPSHPKPLFIQIHKIVSFTEQLQTSRWEILAIRKDFGTTITLGFIRKTG